MVLSGLVAGRFLVQEKSFLQLWAVIHHTRPPGIARELDPDQTATAVLHAHLENISVQENILQFQSENILQFQYENILQFQYENILQFLV